MASLWNVCDSLFSCFRGERSYSVEIEMDSMERGSEVQVITEGCCERIRRIWDGWSCATKVCVVATGCIITVGTVLSIGMVASAVVGSAVAAKGVTTKSPHLAEGLIAANTTPIYQKTNRVSSRTLNRILDSESGDTTYRLTKATTQSTVNLVSGKIHQPITDRVQMTTYRLQSAIANQQTEASTQSTVNSVSSTIDQQITDGNFTISYGLNNSTPNKQTKESIKSTINPESETNKPIVKLTSRLTEDLITIKQLFIQTSWITNKAFAANTETSEKKTPDKVTKSTTTLMLTVGEVAKTVTINKETKVCTAKGWYPYWNTDTEKWDEMHLEADLAVVYYKIFDLYRFIMSWSCILQEYKWEKKNPDMAFHLSDNGQFSGKGFFDLNSGTMNYNYSIERMVCVYKTHTFPKDDRYYVFFKEAYKKCKELVIQDL